MATNFTILADAHLWPTLRSKQPDMLYDTFYAAEEVINYAVKNNTHLIIAGDLFHTIEKSEVAQCVRFLSKSLRELIHNGKNVFYIYGNHDEPKQLSFKPPHWLDVSLYDYSAQVMPLDCPQSPYDVGGVTLQGVNYHRTPKRILEALEQINSRVDLLVIHQGIKEFIPFKYSYELEKDILRNRAQVIVCGHVHKASVIEEPGLVLISPGSPAITSRSDDPEKTFPVLHFDKRNFLGYDLIKLQNLRTFKSFVCSEQQDYEDVLAYLCKDPPKHPAIPELSKPFVYVKYISQHNFYERLIAAAKDKYFLETVAVNHKSNPACLEAVAMAERPLADITADHVDRSNTLLFETALELQKDQIKRPEDIIENKIRSIIGEGDV